MEWKEVVADAREIHFCVRTRILPFRLKLKANNTVIKSAANRPVDRTPKPGQIESPRHRHKRTLTGRA